MIEQDWYARTSCYVNVKGIGALPRMSDDLSRMSRGELLALLRVERSQVERDLATKRRSAARVQEVRQIPRAIAESEALGSYSQGI